jgi:hypothetical protein
MNDHPNQPPAREDTAKIVAQVLLWTFVIAFGLLFIVNVALTFRDKGAQTAEDDLSKGWLDMLKNSLVLLSTALTTVIGYYFGQRESIIARKEAKAAEKRAENSKQEAEEAEEAKMSIKEKFDNFSADISSGMSDDFNAVRASLPKKPKK